MAISKLLSYKAGPEKVEKRKVNIRLGRLFQSKD